MDEESPLRVFINRVTTLCYSLKMNNVIECRKTLIQNKMTFDI